MNVRSETEIQIHKAVANHMKKNGLAHLAVTCFACDDHKDTFEISIHSEKQVQFTVKLED